MDASQAERLGRSCFSIARSALSLARSAQAERDNESCFFNSLSRFLETDLRRITRLDDNCRCLRLENLIKLLGFAFGYARVDVERMPSFCTTTVYTPNDVPDRYPVIDSDPDPAVDVDLTYSRFRPHSPLLISNPRTQTPSIEKQTKILKTILSYCIASIAGFERGDRIQKFRNENNLTLSTPTGTAVMLDPSNEGRFTLLRTTTKITEIKNRYAVLCSSSDMKYLTTSEAGVPRKSLHRHATPAPQCSDGDRGNFVLRKRYRERLLIKL
ncbi:hypothetical protein EVAR_28798_1 [Eumeta japonica]|uniref:Uncharacterized protein n=1 Tax=Eumeta variegata TaxID=151549 RepID=A0A4C1VIJ8_EUMVA|nr:hypothetical protein EVAR_28798_1 [Eumeta japonica]